MMKNLLVFAPSRRAQTETFVRANLERLPFHVDAYFGDELPLADPWRFSYGLTIVVSKLLTRLRLLNLATLLPSLMAWLLVLRHQPDVLMVEFGFHAVRVMEVAAWCRVPMVVHFRGSDASAEAYLGVLRKRYRRLLRLVAAVIVKSMPMRTTLMELGAAPESILVSPSGADERLFHGSRPAAVAACFVAVGRFVAKKGPLETLEAFAAMQQRLPEDLARQTSLIMVGEGPLLTEVRQRVQMLGLQKCVQLPGVLDRQGVAALLRQARAFVQHSRVAPNGDSEGSPVAVMEAQLSGLPVVATHHAGIPEVVLDGVTGFLVEEGDVPAMAEAMARLVLDPSLAAVLGAAARKRMVEGFTVAHHLAAVTALLESALSVGASERL
jgi:glycosyltransferase involved in cell wall biosynthesis